MIGGWESAFRVSSCVLKPFGDQPVNYAANPPPTPRRADVAVSPDRTEAEVNVAPDNALAANVHKQTKPASEAKPDVEPDHSSDDSTGAAANTETTRADRLPDEAKPTPWQAVVDPLPGWNPQAAGSINVPLARDGWAIIPEGRSHFFAVGLLEGNSRRWQVYDLRNGTAVGVDVTLDSQRGIYQLSDSGRYLLSYVGVGSASRVEVHSFVSGQLVYSTDSPDERIWDYRRDYVTAQHGLVSFREHDQQLQISRVDLKTGQPTVSWEPGLAVQQVNTFAITPGGRQVVLQSDQAFSIYDLTSKQLVGRLALPKMMETVLALAFSGDGTELAVVGSHRERPTPIFWCIDWATGQTKLTADVAAELESLSSNYHLGPALEWFPAGDLLLYYGRDVIDRRTGRFCYRIEPNMYWQMPRRAVV